MKKPRVSIIMSVYNGEKFLVDAIESIVAQTYTDFEFLIVDDASVDKTSEILENFVKKDTRIKVFEHTENKGLTQSLNELLQIAQGEYIARMDADDIAYPNRIREQVAFLDAQSNMGLVGTQYEEIGADGDNRGEKKFPVENDVLQKVLIKYNPFFHGSVMFRRDVVMSLGGYDADILKAQDYDLWLRMAQIVQIGNIDQTLMQRRYSSDMISIAKENEQLKAAIGVRKAAISRRQYPWWAYIYVLRPWIVLHTPYAVRKLIRRKFLSNKMYD